MSKDPAKSRRNVLLFWAHVGLALLLFAAFVYNVVNK
jgi:hypothetical protein